MKLILKRLSREIEVTSLDSECRHYVPGGRDPQAPFALHTEDGTVLPSQQSTTLHS
ncbi:hypothetical protein [Pseudomonas putida]|uniref:hypothetical protein n=1 Tax=Pseudomonas putida TaxID=303 RepID=UPI000281E338|nr:hypothetical protein [Pseudomonas putida]EMR47055.1 hypothetical protein PPUTLS46_011380 [Pseudomonas putida LS46]